MARLIVKKTIFGAAGKMPHASTRIMPTIRNNNSVSCSQVRIAMMRGDNLFLENGGANSGNWGHAGRAGLIGGSSAADQKRAAIKGLFAAEGGEPDRGNPRMVAAWKRGEDALKAADHQTVHEALKGVMDHVVGGEPGSDPKQVAAWNEAKRAIALPVKSALPGGFIHEDKTMRIEPAHKAAESGTLIHDIVIKGQNDGQKPVSLQLKKADMDEIQAGRFPKQVTAQIKSWGKNDGDLDQIHEKGGYVNMSKMEAAKFGKGTPQAADNALVGQCLGRAKAYIARARDYAPEEVAHKVLLTRAADMMDIASKKAVKLPPLGNRAGNLPHQGQMPGAPVISRNIPPAVKNDDDGDGDEMVNCVNCGGKSPAGKFCLNCGFQHPAAVKNTGNDYSSAISFIRNHKTASPVKTDTGYADAIKSIRNRK